MLQHSCSLSSQKPGRNIKSTIRQQFLAYSPSRCSPLFFPKLEGSTKSTQDYLQLQSCRCQAVNCHQISLLLANPLPFFSPCSNTPPLPLPISTRPQCLLVYSQASKPPSEPPLFISLQSTARASLLSDAEHSKIRLAAALSSLRSSLLHLELQELLPTLTNVFLLAAPPLDLEAPLAYSNQLRHGPSCLLTHTPFPRTTGACASSRA